MYRETKLSKLQKQILLSMRGLSSYTDSLAWKIAKENSKLEYAESHNYKWPPEIMETYTHYKAILIDCNADGSVFRVKEQWLFPRFKASFSRSIKRLVERGIIEKERYQRRIELTYKGQTLLEQWRQ